MLGFFWFFGFFLLGILKTNRTKEGKGRKKGSREEERKKEGKEGGREE